MAKQQFFTDTMWPPNLDQVKMYFSQKGMNEQEAQHFFQLYQIRQWRTKKGEMIKNWKNIESINKASVSGFGERMIAR